MKRLFVLTVLVLGLGTVCAQERSLAEAMDIANAVIKADAQKAPSRNHAATALAFDSELTTQLAETESDTPFYVFKEDNAGFIIVSADKRMLPVLGYSDTPIPSDAQLPPAFLELLRQYKAEWESVRASASIKMINAPKADGPQKVGPLLTTTWNQDNPYNRKTPIVGGQPSVTGCTATALSQIMNFHKYPETGRDSISYYLVTDSIPVNCNFSSITFDWDRMRDSYSPYAENDEYTDAVSTLLFAVGAAIRTDFTPDNSSAGINFAMIGMNRYFGYDKDMYIANKENIPAEEWDPLLKKEIDAHRPVTIAGYTEQYLGHAFVADGYEFKDDALLFHINWGWGGMCDGMFPTSSLKPETYYIGGASGSYSFKQMALVGIQPDNGVADRAGSLQGQTVSLSSLTCAPAKSTVLTVVMQNLYNYGAEAFNGEIVITLEGAGGTSWTIGKISDLSLETFSGFSSISSSVTIPASVSEGTYSIVFKTHLPGTETYTPITFGCGNPMLMVADTGEDPNADVFYPNLQTSGMSISQSVSNDRKFTVIVENLANFGYQAFAGYLALVVTDLNDNELAVFNERTEVSTSLPSYMLFNTPFSVSGTLPDVVYADGRYRLYVAGNQQGYRGWGYLQKYILTGSNVIEDSDIKTYFDMWIVDGKVRITAPDPLKVNVSVEGNGSVTTNPAGEMEMFGDLVVTVAPESDSKLTKLVVNGEDVTERMDGMQYTLFNVIADVEISAVFDLLDRVAVAGSDLERFDVFSSTGVCVLHSASVQRLSDLPKGIYLVRSLQTGRTLKRSR